MLVLRADPWMPEYGMGFDAPLGADGPEAVADPFVETRDWSSPRSPGPPDPGPLWFVDGVRRVDLRLLADDGDRRVPGLFGSFAVGSVRCDRRAAFGDHEVGRAIVLGGGVRAEAVEAPLAGGRVRFAPSTVPGEEPDAPLLGLQELMRRAEGATAARLAAEEGTLVLADGPLTFHGASAAPVVGVVKRTARRYLGPEHEALVGRLGPGQRTPLFSLGEDERVRRYSWYARLVPLRLPWHDHAGIVRCEVRVGIGEPGHVAALADRVSALLPTFAGRPTDPRAPQNLAPVGGLEAWLRHRMGHPGLVRRALTDWLRGREG